MGKILSLVLLIFIFINCNDNKFHSNEIRTVDIESEMVEVSRNYPAAEIEFSPSPEDVKHVDREVVSAGNYEYSYNVEGEDDAGIYWAGDIEITDNVGSGTLTNQHGDEVLITCEFVNYGVIEAHDTEGKKYDLKVK